MPKLRDYFRALPGAAGISGRTVTVKKHLDNSTVTTATTDGNGLFDLPTLGYVGPVYYTVSDGTTTRVHSSKSEGQVGAWFPAQGVYAFRALTDGVITGPFGANSLLVSAPGSGMTVNVAAGAALGAGQPYVWASTQAVTIGAADPTNPRIDTVILRFCLPGHAEEGKIDLLAKAGTAAATPAAPALTQDAATTFVWEVALADVLVDAAAGSIAPTKVTDRRAVVAPLPGSVGTAQLADGSVTGAKLADGTIGTADLADGSVTDPKMANQKVNRAGDTMTGALNIVSGSEGAIGIKGNSHTAVDVGRDDVAGGLTYFDLHSSDNANDYDTRLAFTGGSAAAGQGTLNIQNAALQWNGSAIAKLSDVVRKTGDTMTGGLVLDTSGNNLILQNGATKRVYLSDNIHIVNGGDLVLWSDDLTTLKAFIHGDDGHAQFSDTQINGIATITAVLTALSNVEFGAQSGAGGAVVWDAHTGFPNNYDFRLFFTGGTSGSDGHATLNLQGAGLQFNGVNVATATDLAGKVGTSGDWTMGGALHVNGQLTTDGGLFAPWGEIGTPGVAASRYFDFHSSANSNDYDSRIIATGGAASAGQGTLNFQTGALQWNGSTLAKLSDIPATAGGAQALNDAFYDGTTAPLNVTSTSGAVVSGAPTCAITLPNDGKSYDVTCWGAFCLSTGTAGQIRAALGWSDQAPAAGEYIGTSVDGERAPGLGKRRTGGPFVGAGQTYTAQLYAKVDAGTGHINSGSIHVMATPR